MGKKANLLLIVLVPAALFLFVTFAQNADRSSIAAENDLIPVPAQGIVISCAPSEAPALGSDPYQAVPIGIGLVANGGDTLSLHLGLSAFAEPVDLYFGIFMPELDPDNIYILTPELALQPHSVGIFPWKTNVTGSIDETLFGDIPVSLLPLSTYAIYLCATPAGQGFSRGFYLWSTAFEAKQATVSYATDIEPLLKAKCSGCHSGLSISYTWAKTFGWRMEFTGGHNGAFWSASEASTIEEWISGGELP
jgi:hypothetical protein